jgi:hypothetical protein
MNLVPIETVDEISAEDFKNYYYKARKPLVIKNLAKQWPAYEKWTFDYIKSRIGDVKVGVYNNTKSDPHTRVNKSDGQMKFVDYLDLIKQGPVGLRIFLFNIFDHCPELIYDFSYPEDLMKGFLKKYPMLFTGGEGSITHMHYDMDLSNILHTQFLGSKRALLFSAEEGKKMYHLPFTVQSLVNFEKYYDGLDEKNYPALKFLNGYECVLDHGDTLFMPAGYWHHMEYIQSGLALSLRAFDESIAWKIRGIYNVLGMRNIDTFLKKAAPDVWYNYKKDKAFKNAEKVLVSES